MEITGGESLKHLPSDVLLLIFGKVASHSIEDITNLKLSCWGFYYLAESNYVYERVSLDKFALGPLEWVTNAKPFLHRVRVNGSEEEEGEAYYNPDQVYKRFRQVVFLKRCRDTGNPEVLYREGLVNYSRETSTADVQALALHAIKTAAEKGHHDAKYASSIILMASVDERERSMGFEFFRSLHDKCLLRPCRQRVRLFIRLLWVRKEMDYPGIPICNPSICETRFTEDDHSLSENHEIGNMLGYRVYQRCKADFEVHLFCIMTLI
ncbi:putative F-box protein At1g67623 [Gastrolobium bilobum]|uniref:putative F-box protein At1g67623 n=1 Tax=Gastrolobium bilobum TaxID=150636 RepID=UPI002AB19223|nr:putative F-box protein At1g67623 [Gastrolobium bilobum]